MNTDGNFNMKKIYFAGHFYKTHDATDVAQMLRFDYRAKLLGTPEHMAYHCDNLRINDKYLYCGPFYIEKTSDGKISATDSEVVISTEYSQVKSCDIFVVVFDKSLSTGAVTELAWAINHKKQIYILYIKQPSSHDIKSDYWFAIADAIRRNKNTTVIAYKKESEIIEIIKRNILKEHIK